MNNKCPICEQPTYLVYGKNPRKDGLCKAHANMLFNKEIEQCANCNAWHKTNEICKCEEKDNNYRINRKCLLCNNETENGNLFCKEHYFKYKDKTITVTIKNLSDFNIVDEYGNRDVKTANGMYVRSQQEKIIYDELYSRNIKCEYERTEFYKDADGTTKELHPDFYLPDYNIYIEHWGYENSKDKKYIAEKVFKEKIYKEKGIKIAGTSSEDIKDIKKAIDRIFFENGIKIN